MTAAHKADAVLSTGVFATAFPNASVRTRDNSTLRGWRDAGSPASGFRPGEGEAVARTSDGEAVIRYDTVPPVAGMTGDLEAMANYAGQSAAVVVLRQPAVKIVRDVAAEADESSTRSVADGLNPAGDDGPTRGGEASEDRPPD